jgi:mRNA interferase MazF
MQKRSTQRSKNLFNPGDVVAVDFPGVTGVKRRPAVVLSSITYHKEHPDIVVGLITSQSIALSSTDCLIEDWKKVGLRLPSVFRSFFVTLPPSSNPVFVGHLSDRDWKSVCSCVKLAFVPLDEPKVSTTPTP